MQTTLQELLIRTVPPLSDAIVTAQARWSWSTLAQLIAQLAPQLADLNAKRVAFVHRGDGPSWAALAAMESHNVDVFLLNPSSSADEQRSLCAQFKLAASVTIESAGNVDIQRSANAPAGSGDGSVTILTSGTAGLPKAVRHTWASLCRPIRRGGIRNPVWLQTYRPNLYAGLQVALQCFANDGKLVCPDPDADLDDILWLMGSEGVEFASATPSYWRRLLVFGDRTKFAGILLRQITLGGEPVDQQVLDMLRETFPETRIVHIYATSELGRCFSVSDGQAGFPPAFIGAVSSDGVELKVDEGELFVRSANAMLGYDGAELTQRPIRDWFATGDLVRPEGDRYVFVGRKSDLINVGGNKVSPQEVEPVLRGVPGVADVRVYGKRSSLVGQLVVAQVVPSDPEQADALRGRINEACLRGLAPHQRPRVIEMVSKIELSEAGKIVRR